MGNLHGALVRSCVSETLKGTGSRGVVGKIWQEESGGSGSVAGMVHPNAWGGVGGGAREEQVNQWEGKKAPRLAWVGVGHAALGGRSESRCINSRTFTKAYPGHGHLGSECFQDICSRVPHF